MLRVGLSGLVVMGLSTLAIAACSVTSTDGTPGTGTPGPNNGNDGGSVSEGGANIEGGSTEDGGGTDGGTKPAASTKPEPVDIDGTCSAFAACGGALSGTYDYTGGCLTNAFAAARQQCPAIDVSGANVTVTGSIYFLTPGTLARDVTTRVTGTIVVPASCAAGQCNLIQTALGAGFDSVTCTGSSSCTCTVAKTDVERASEAYTITGNRVLTASGETYDYCTQAATLGYEGKSAGTEVGIWQLKKR
jgi:hypothetical protein